MNKLLIYIVSYQRKEYTQGTIEAAHKQKPNNSQIIVCDNGSTDGTREWLQENQEKYSLGLIFPDQNLRVGGAWTLLTNYFDENEFDYILCLDNDHWLEQITPDWFEQCLTLFSMSEQIGSLGLYKERIPGHFAKEQILDPNFSNIKSYKEIEFYDTVYYAGARLDKFNLWYTTMKNWPHKFIGDKIGTYYNSLGYRTLKFKQGFITDISTYNFNNLKHEEYNKWFYNREREEGEFERVSNLSIGSTKLEQFVISNFGNHFIKYLT